MDAYNTATVASVLDVSLRKLGHWDKKNLVKPSVSCAAGRGSRRLYSFLDIVELRTVQALREDGISLQKIRKVVAFLRKNLGKVKRPLAGLEFLTDGVSVFVLTKDAKTVMDALAGGQLVHAVPLGYYYELLERKMSEVVRAQVDEVVVGDFTYKVTVEPDMEDGGFVVSCPALKGCHSQGETREEALETIKDAIAIHEDIRLERKGQVKVQGA